MGSWGDRVTVHYGSPARNLHELRSAPLHECEGVGVAVSIDIPTGPSETGRGSRHEAGPLKLGSQTPTMLTTFRVHRPKGAVHRKLLRIRREGGREKIKRFTLTGLKHPRRDSKRHG